MENEELAWLKRIEDDRFLQSKYYNTLIKEKLNEQKINYEYKLKWLTMYYEQKLKEITMKMSDEQFNNIEMMFKEKRATHPCPRCGKNDIYGVINEVFLENTLQTIMSVCENCGYIMKYLLGVMMKKSEEQS
jgi:DNA-directed RNA polymerase subunit M/transcription elongation factor TFIIS